MTAIDLAVARSKVNEGFRANVYIDTTGHRSLGYGFNIDAGITEPAAAALLRAQIEAIAGTLGPMWWAEGLDDTRLSVVLELALNLGIHGLLNFVNMLSAIGKHDWQTAHDALLDSQAARQLPTRYQALALILLNGSAPQA